ncbi:MAG: hypothetical protein JWQ71_764 [Pedosphaera sp.]|nr:hypothetical protein [Pedosphaera sp.]
MKVDLRGVHGFMSQPQSDDGEIHASISGEYPSDEMPQIRKSCLSDVKIGANRLLNESAINGGQICNFPNGLNSYPLPRSQLPGSARL